MLRSLRKSRAASTVEYVALLLFILTTFVVLEKYIIRGFAGRWKSVGDVFGHGKQYDPKPFGAEGKGGGTLECVLYRDPSTGAPLYWVMQNCLDSKPECAPGGTCPPAVAVTCRNVTYCG